MSMTTTMAPLVPTPTYQYSRVRERLWCCSCQGTKDQGLLVCWPCHTRLKRRFDGGYGAAVTKRIQDLDLYLFDHNDTQARSWLGEA